MLTISSLEDIAALRESADVECKLAHGRDGNGDLPRDVWSTYSAFANTAGGDIFLGLKENKDRSFELKGIVDTQKVIEDFQTNVANPEKVSCNLMRDNWIKVLTIEGKKIIQIHVPPAGRKQRPVYLHKNPLTGTYKRMSTADIRQSEEVVRRMLAEQVEDSRDTEVLRGYDLHDLDLDSFNVFRNMYSALRPDHPWNKVDEKRFLYNIGAWGKNREEEYEGLTRAGLLMFGEHRPILDIFPYYMVDYQEQLETQEEARWVDRLIPDGNWSGNVFDFYQMVIRRLTRDLKVPFELIGNQRRDDTVVHKALREALVNTLVHSDYSGRTSVLVIKRPTMFSFRNPGNMRVPIEDAIEGSVSDCRNRNLQKMFTAIGLGENAGSGLPKIFDGWKSQHWRDPNLRENIDLDYTLLELRMLSLVPPEALDELRELYSDAVFDALSENERLVLVTASIEGTIDHQRMMSVVGIHPRDLTLLFGSLVDRELLSQEGIGRGTLYFLPILRSIEGLIELTEDLTDLMKSEASSIEAIDSKAFTSMAASIANKKKAPKAEMEHAIITLCSIKELTIGQLESLLNRSGEFLRKQYLQPLIKDNQLKLKYSTTPNHPKQAYSAIKKLD